MLLTLLHSEMPKLYTHCTQKGQNCIPIALRKAKIVYNFVLYGCNRVKRRELIAGEQIPSRVPIEKGSKNENGRVVSPESVSIDIKDLSNEFSLASSTFRCSKVAKSSIFSFGTLSVEVVVYDISCYMLKVVVPVCDVSC